MAYRQNSDKHFERIISVNSFNSVCAKSIVFSTVLANHEQEMKMICPSSWKVLVDWSFDRLFVYLFDENGRFPDPTVNRRFLNTVGMRPCVLPSKIGRPRVRKQCSMHDHIGGWLCIQCRMFLVFHGDAITTSELFSVKSRFTAEENALRNWWHFHLLVCPQIKILLDKHQLSFSQLQLDEEIEKHTLSSSNSIRV